MSRQIIQVGAITTIKAPDPAPIRRCYVPGAGKYDVLRDQLEYLIEHSQGCGEKLRDCPDCRRMATVSDGLLAPFRRSQR